MQDENLTLSSDVLSNDEVTEGRKGQARKTALGARAEIKGKRRTRLSRQLNDLAAEAMRGCAVVAAYVPYRTEPDCLPLIEELAAAGTRVLVPKLGPGLSRDWAWFAGTDDLAVRSPGRPAEPSGEALGPEILGEADAVLVPALGVDLAGYRLGRGGGWYDRALLQVRPGTPIYAAVYDEEVLEDGFLPRGSHDIPVTHVVTPTRLIEVSKSKG